MPDELTGRPIQAERGTSVKRALLVGGASAALVLGGVAAPVSAAEGQRLAFNSVSQGPEWQLEGNRHFTSVEKLWRSGKHIGFGVLNCKFLVRVQKLDCSYVASVFGGTISVELDRFGENNNGHYTGTIVGGTGRYKGVHGTAAAHDVKPRVVKILLTFSR